MLENSLHRCFLICVSNLSVNSSEHSVLLLLLPPLPTTLLWLLCAETNSYGNPLVPSPLHLCCLRGCLCGCWIVWQRADGCMKWLLSDFQSKGMNPTQTQPYKVIKLLLLTSSYLLLPGGLSDSVTALAEFSKVEIAHWAASRSYWLVWVKLSAWGSKASGKSDAEINYDADGEEVKRCSPPLCSPSVLLVRRCGGNLLLDDITCLLMTQPDFDPATSVS